MNRNPVLLFAFLTIGILSFPSQSALYSPYVVADYIYDDNLFRTTNDNESEAITGDDDVSESIYHFGAGVEGELNLSRQSLSYDALIYKNIYDNFSRLDHNGGQFRLQADYEIGKLILGQVKYRFTRVLSDFEQYQVFKKSMKSIHTVSLDGEYRLTTRLNAIAGVDFSAVDFTGRNTGSVNKVNRQETGYALGVKYNTRLDNTIGARLRVGNTRFPDRNVFLDDPDEVDNEYAEQSAELFVDWDVSVHSNLSGNIGYMDREQEHFSSGDFDGLVGSVRYLWQPRSKIRFDLRAHRKLSSLEGEALNYALTEGYSIRPIWDLTSKVRLYVQYEHDKQDFRGVSDLDVGIESSTRKNTTDLYSLGVMYEPRRHIAIEMAYRNGERDSSDDQRDFDYSRFFVSAKYNFK
ncbi:MAG: hypothetical protein V3W04_06840 [Gammaproteobacteria bacterium]